MAAALGDVDEVALGLALPLPPPLELVPEAVAMPPPPAVVVKDEGGKVVVAVPVVFCTVMKLAAIGAPSPVAATKLVRLKPTRSAEEAGGLILAKAAGIVKLAGCWKRKKT